MKADFAGPAGRLEGLLDTPDHPEGAAPRALVVFAHPHPLEGGTMHTKVVYQGAKALARVGCAVLRFNFRGVGMSEGAFDHGRGEMDDFRAAVDHLRARFPDAPEMWAAGFSFGAWIAMMAGAADDRISALIGLGPPVERRDFDAVRRSTKPKFFLQGEFDQICPLSGLRQFYALAAEPKDLVVIDAADHLFTGAVTEVSAALEELLGDFSANPRAT